MYAYTHGIQNYNLPSLRIVFKGLKIAILIKQNKTKMATLFALPVCQSLKNKLHPRKTNTHTANKEKELLTDPRYSAGQRTMAGSTASWV
jgi:hypothetical protein